MAKRTSWPRSMDTQEYALRTTAELASAAPKVKFHGMSFTARLWILYDSSSVTFLENRVCAALDQHVRRIPLR